MKEIERRPINSDLLRAFTVIAEQGHLTAAAAILNRTQSAISVQLRKLEAELGVPLFKRTPQGMVLTPQGEKLVPVARAALDDLTKARSLFADPLTGMIRVGILDDFDDFVLERVLAQFARQNPSVEVVATSGCTSGFARMIAADEMDVAVVSGPQSEGDELLSIEDTVWAVERSLPLNPEQAVPLVLLDRSCWWKDLAADALNDAKIPFRVAFKSSSFASLKAAIRAGLGVGIMPRHSVEPAMRVLGHADGFPVLPAAHRSILLNPKCDQNLGTAMQASLRGL